MTKTTSDGLDRTPVSRRIDGYRPNAADVRAMMAAEDKRDRRRMKIVLQQSMVGIGRALTEMGYARA